MLAFVSFREKLSKRAKRAGVTLSEGETAALSGYFELLGKWNQKVSLTSLPVNDLSDEAIDRLLIEPLVAARFLPKRPISIIDIGSGGGSPAIPLRIAANAASLRMVESKARKAAFLREVVRHLGLAATEVESTRFEELLARPELHESADVISLRAVRVERKVLAALQGLLKPGGLLFLFRASPSLDGQLLGTSLVLQAVHPLLSQKPSYLVVVEKR